MVRQPKILVIDDNAQNRALAQATLEDSDLEVLIADSGQRGIELFHGQQPDCVLLDVRMPGLDGFAVCEQLRASEQGADVPIVFLTAQRDLDTFDAALRAGGDDFLLKPIQPTQLVVRVQAALKLRRLGAELREHYQLVRNQRDELMRLQLQKERLMAFVVHDLKNPVNAMDLHAQLLLRNREVPEQARDSAQRIRSEARALLRLLYNLLDISKSEEGDLVVDLGAVDARGMVAEVREAFEVHAAASEVTLDVVVTVDQLCADADLLRRVLENLVDNAIRHAPRGSAVEIRVLSPNGTGVQLWVADRGRGIQGEMRERVFDRFVQVDGGDQIVSRAGRGLGLAFCKLAVEAHGGSIRVEDNDPGTAFCVTLPNNG